MQNNNNNNDDDDDDDVDDDADPFNIISILVTVCYYNANVNVCALHVLSYGYLFYIFFCCWKSQNKKLF